MNWQYQVRPFSAALLSEEALNAMGEHGWELVATTPVFVFKRAVAPFGDRQELSNRAERPMLLSIAQTCRHLGFSRTKVHQLLKSGRLPFVKIGRSVRIPTAAVEEWLAQERHTAGKVGTV